MMNKSTAERILGFDVDLYPIEDKFVGNRIEYGYEAAANWEYGTETVKARTADEALRILVDTIYKRRSAWIMKKQKYRCAECGELNALEIDHKIPRSKGRDDRIENLRAVCASFTGCRIHEKKHHG